MPAQPCSTLSGEKKSVPAGVTIHRTSAGAADASDVAVEGFGALSRLSLSPADDRRSPNNKLNACPRSLRQAQSNQCVCPA